jgi:hypothetical protein
MSKDMQGEPMGDVIHALVALDKLRLAYNAWLWYEKNPMLDKKGRDAIYVKYGKVLKKMGLVWSCCQ